MAAESTLLPSPDAIVIRTIGVCGGIGSGKSAACKLMVDELNCVAHIDSDKMAHAVYAPGSQAVEEVANTFGRDLVDDNGVLDRAKLGTIVFSDIEEMKKLERIVWPHVNKNIQAEIESLKTRHAETREKIPVIVVEAAVLLDAGWQEDFLDEVW